MHKTVSRAVYPDCGFLSARCRRVSVIEFFFPHVAGEFLRSTFSSCTLQESFRDRGFYAARSITIIRRTGKQFLSPGNALYLIYFPFLTGLLRTSQ
jgi:hypothetical protein